MEVQRERADGEAQYSEKPSIYSIKTARDRERVKRDMLQRQETDYTK